MDSATDIKPPHWEIAGSRSEPLFKFRSFNSERDLDPSWQGYAASVLRDGLIYYASPWDLNDPWEGRPPFVIPDPDIDSKQAEAFADMLHTESREVPREEFDCWLAERGFAQVAREMQDEHWRTNKNYGVFSLAGNATHPLMWSHYCDSHRGFCFVFDHTKHPFSSAAKVSYVSECPQIDWASWKQQDLVKLSLLTKADYWSHEDEYRMLLPSQDYPERFNTVPFSGQGVVPFGRYLQIDPACVIAIIFGAGASVEVRSKLVRLAVAYRPNLEFHVAGIHRREYRMMLRSLTTNEINGLL